MPVGAHQVQVGLLGVVADPVERLPHLLSAAAERGDRDQRDLERDGDQPGDEGGGAAADQQHPLRLDQRPVVGDLPVAAGVRPRVEQVVVPPGLGELAARGTLRRPNLDRPRLRGAGLDVPADDVGLDEPRIAGVDDDVAPLSGQLPAQRTSRGRRHVRVAQRGVIAAGGVHASHDRDQWTPHGHPLSIGRSG